MVGNLVDNAVRYTPAGGHVTAKVETLPEHVRISVEDNGPGIPASDRERVFERFYRGLGTNQEGSGLGLSIVREIARLHDAGVRCEDGAGGKGIRFCIDIPKAPEMAEAAAPGGRSTLAGPEVTGS